jgi:hypothetical protein
VTKSKLVHRAALIAALSLVFASFAAADSDINPFTGKKSSSATVARSKKKAEEAKGPANPNLPPPMPPTLPQQNMGMMLHQNDNGGPAQEKRSAYRVVGTIDGMVSLSNAAGDITIVRNGEEIDGCVVDYPTIECEKDAVKAKQAVAKHEYEKLRVENARLSKDLADAKAKTAHPVEAVRAAEKPVVVVAQKSISSPQPAPGWFPQDKAVHYDEANLGKLDAVIGQDRNGKSIIVAVKAEESRQQVLDSALKKYIRGKVVADGHVYYQVAGLVAKNVVR